VSGTLRELFAAARGIIADNRCCVLSHRAFNGNTEITHEELVRFPIIGSEANSRWILTAAFTF
jgi:hypothetical protein